jgi:predicted transcriptional regulator
MNESKDFAVLLRVDRRTVRAVDNVASTLRMNRSEFIRKSIARNLDYALKNEVPLVLNNPLLRNALDRC